MLQRGLCTSMFAGGVEACYKVVGPTSQVEFPCGRGLDSNLTPLEGPQPAGALSALSRRKALAPTKLAPVVSDVFLLHGGFSTWPGLFLDGSWLQESKGSTEGKPPRPYEKPPTMRSLSIFGDRNGQLRSVPQPPGSSVRKEGRTSAQLAAKAPAKT